MAHIEDHFDPSSPLYSFAVEALQTSYTWTLGLLKFGGDTGRTYDQATFLVTVVWHVATRLMKVLIVEVTKKRHRVSMALKAANQIQIAKVTLMAILRSLDVIRNIQDQNFANHPAVANERVKFLAVNTEFQSVKDL